ncbi:hypothetical protein Xind_03886 [Xenorhabdus indica]|nr:hypothetical protein [Xenorhabdus indica]
MTAKLKEMIITTHALQSQQVLPDLSQHRFHFTNRGFIIAYSHGRLIRCGQCLTVKFAIRRKREGFQHHKSAGDHVFSQMLSQLLAQFSRDQFNAGLRLEIGHQTGIARNIFARNDNSFIDPRTLNKLCFYLTRLNTEATDLDLKVVAPQIVNIAIGQPATEVTGLVHSGIRCS